MRDGPAGLEVLLLQRASSLAFHGGAWVFPGGRVDETDGPGTDALTRARHAAVREAREEAQLDIDYAGLVPLSHWTTPRGAPRRFSTWFFLCECDPHAQVVPDFGEVHAHRWMTVRAALSAQAERTMDLPAPTFVTLTSLLPFTRTADALAHAYARTPFVFEPRPRSVSEGVVSLYRGDVAYVDGELDGTGPRHRLCMFTNGWRYERSF
jgi:8-oxo-dGTP pyrophosphatase MutT (NUDIX family)